MKLVCRIAAATSKSASAAVWSPKTPCAIRATSILPSRSAAIVSISGWPAVSSRSITQVSTASAPRVSKSWATAVNRLVLRPTSMKWTCGAASRRMVAIAMLEVAPNTNTWEGNKGSRLAKAGYPLPEAGAKRRIDVGRPLRPLGIKLLEMYGAHARVFGGIHAPAAFGSDVGQPVEETEADLPPDGKIQRQGDAGCGKRHNSGRNRIPEDLDDRKKRAQPGLGDRLQKLIHALGAAFPRQNA